MEGRLSNEQIVRLAHAIASQDMESIGLGYMGIEEETIRNLKAETQRKHRGLQPIFNTQLDAQKCRQ